MREMSRVLRYGGSLVITSENRWMLSRILDPGLTPLITPLRSAVLALVRTLRRHPATGTGSGFPKTFHSPVQIDRMMTMAGTEKIKSFTVGFGPFGIMGRPVLKNTLGIRLHRILQKLADRRVPVIRSTGSHYIAVALKQMPGNAHSGVRNDGKDTFPVTQFG